MKLFISIALLLSILNSYSQKIESLDIDLVPSDFPVNFCLYTFHNKQFVAYYDVNHVMTVAARDLKSDKWQYKKLNSKIGWDSHNYITMAIDKAGYIHLIGNMHCSSINYFKSSAPLDIETLEQQAVMVSQKDEQVMTYPRFIDSPDGKIIFHYRHGGSGNGCEIYNVYDPNSKQWRRLLDTSLIDGQQQRSAYIQGPVVGKDGYYHMVWVWRNTPDCATNHTLSYARSKDMYNWESAMAEPVKLPITIADTLLIVDPVPEYGGLINIGVTLGFGHKNEPIIGYHKYDSQGHTQLTLARFENGKWQCVQQTKWNYRWDFKGGGTIVNELLIGTPHPYVARKLRIEYHKIDSGDSQIVVDSKTLSPLREESAKKIYPQQMDVVESDFPGMLVNKTDDIGKAPQGKKYILRWETLPANRDHKREGALPPPSVLKVCII